MKSQEAERIELLERKLRAVPPRPGAYLMKAARGDVIYVGKAKNLRNRIRNYFQGTDTRAMVPFLVSRVRDLDFVVTNTEKEAFLSRTRSSRAPAPLQRDLPRRQDLLQPALDTRLDFRRSSSFERRKDGARYFALTLGARGQGDAEGFCTGSSVRTCKDREFNTRRRPCIEYEIRNCVGPCVGLVGKGVPEVHRRRGPLPRGPGDELWTLKARWRGGGEPRVRRGREAARPGRRRRDDGGEAAVVSAEFKDQDIFVSTGRGQVMVCILRIREGKTLGTKKFPPIRRRPPTPRSLVAAEQCYDGEHFFPPRSSFPKRSRTETSWQNGSREAGEKVDLIVPHRGPRKDLVGSPGRTPRIHSSRRAVRIDEEAAWPCCGTSCTCTGLPAASSASTSPPRGELP
jgi:excinuclease ABC subunit C